jgi:hypothetical protein
LRQVFSTEIPISNKQAKVFNAPFDPETNWQKAAMMNLFTSWKEIHDF